MKSLIKKLIALYKKHKEVINYLIVGGLTTLVSFLVQWLFTYPIPLHTVAATLLAIVISITFAYFTNKIFVFESKQTEKKGFLVEISLFYLSRAGTGGLEVLLMYIFVDLLRFEPMLMKLIINVIIIILNYVLSKFIVFRKKK
ncbi:MAG: GtrA family protein [Clostridia bacterium]|nr:GtrA family protein [Clostridia bacterium]